MKLICYPLINPVPEVKAWSFISVAKEERVIKGWSVIEGKEDKKTRRLAHNPL